MADKLLILFKEEIFPPLLAQGKLIAEKLRLEPLIYCTGCGEQILNSLKEELQKLNFQAEVESTDLDPEEVLEKEKPYLTLLPKFELNPIAHAFKKPWSEKLAIELEKFNLLLLRVDSPKIQKALLYVDRDNSSDNYIRNAYKFLTALGVEFKFTTIFDERYYELLIKKEHPELEAKEILGRMFEDYINAVREKIKKALNLEHVEILPLKGEERKSLPYFAKLHNYDLLVISHAHNDKDEIVQNSETSLAIFEN